MQKVRGAVAVGRTAVVKVWKVLMRTRIIIYRHGNTPRKAETSFPLLGVFDLILPWLLASTALIKLANIGASAAQDC